MQDGYGQAQGLQLLNALLAQGQRVFTTDDATRIGEGFGLGRPSVQSLLHELTRGGWIRRARRGLYYVDESDRGGHTPHPFAIATALVRPSAISHWSALAYHGLTDQIPRIIMASTTKDVVTPGMRDRTSRPDQPASVWTVGEIAIQYVRVKPEHFWGFDEVWIDEHSRTPIMDRERTILDGFLSPAVFGTIGEILGILEEHIAEIDVPKLIAYAIRYDQAATTKRLGYALASFGADDNMLRPLQEALIRGTRLFDPSGPDQGRYDHVWRLRLNLGGRIPVREDRHAS